MKDLSNYECEGQIELTDYLASKIKNNTVKDLTAWMPLPEPYIPDTPQNEPEQSGESWQNAMLSKFLNRRGKSND